MTGAAGTARKCLAIIEILSALSHFFFITLKGYSPEMTFRQDKMQAQQYQLL